MTQPIVRTRFAPLVVGGLALILALVATAPSAIAADDALPTADALAESAPEMAAAAEAVAGSCAAEPSTAAAVLLAGAVSVGGPGDVKDYCTTCRPCTRQIDCGWDNGYTGVCVSNPSSCGSPGHSACICY